MLVVFGSCELDLAPENTMVDETVYRKMPIRPKPPCWELMYD